MDYVCGFMFSAKEDKVAVIRKNKPDFQLHKFNGIGGKIEVGETPVEAISREFKEETGVLWDQWLHFSTLQGKDFEVYFFAAFTDKVFDVKTTTDEEVFVLPWKDLLSCPEYQCLPNLQWLVPMALSLTAHDWPYLIVENKG